MKIELIKGDITELEVDAIVNAANSRLAGGGGVDGAIHRAGGPSIMAECDAIRGKNGGCLTGQAVITSGGNLAAKFVIHTVGPVWKGGQQNEKELLSSAYKSSMKKAFEAGVKSVAFPNISTGIYGYPKYEAADIAIETVKNFLNKNAIPEHIIFVCFDE
ncbi:O-acetyl-ADP-ribose deacetylase, partial [Bacteroidota bacterium]